VARMKETRHFAGETSWRTYTVHLEGREERGSIT